MTEKEKKVLDYITKYKMVNGFSPTREEIMKGLHYNSRSWIESMLDSLSDQGFIHILPNIDRGIIVIGFPEISIS